MAGADGKTQSAPRPPYTNEQPRASQRLCTSAAFSRAVASKPRSLRRSTAAPAARPDDLRRLTSPEDRNARVGTAEDGTRDGLPCGASRAPDRIAHTRLDCRSQKRPQRGSRRRRPRGEPGVSVRSPTRTQRAARGISTTPRRQPARRTPAGRQALQPTAGAAARPDEGGGGRASRNGGRRDVIAPIDRRSRGLGRTKAGAAAPARAAGGGIVIAPIDRRGRAPFLVGQAGRRRLARRLSCARLAGVRMRTFEQVGNRLESRESRRPAQARPRRRCSSSRGMISTKLQGRWR